MIVSSNIICPSCATVIDFDCKPPFFASCPKCQEVISVGETGYAFSSAVKKYQGKAASLIQLNDKINLEGKTYKISGRINRVTDQFILNQWILNTPDGIFISLVEESYSYFFLKQLDFKFDPYLFNNAKAGQTISLNNEKYTVFNVANQSFFSIAGQVPAAFLQEKFSFFTLVHEQKLEKSVLCFISKDFSKVFDIQITDSTKLGLSNLANFKDWQ